MQNNLTDPVRILLPAGGNAVKAEALTKQFNTMLVNEPDEAGGLYLCAGADGLSLTDGLLSLTVDFDRERKRLLPGNLQREMLVKACRIKGKERPLVVDATAGLGEDSILLAAAGFSVRLYEYNPVIAALLRDGLERAAKNPALAEIVARMDLHEADSVAALPALPQPPDVVLLDPMFPQRQKSALVKKKFQLLQRLEQPCENGAALFAAAVEANPKKIVVKRPVKGEALTEHKPDYSLTGKAIRYDCYVFAH